MADLVICDSSAIFETRDALTLAASVDGTVLILAARETEAHDVTWARRLLLESQASLLGVILNYCSTCSRPETADAEPPENLELCLEEKIPWSRTTA